MGFRRSVTSQSANSAAGQSSGLDTTTAGEVSHDEAVKIVPSDPDDTYQPLSSMKTILLLVSVMLSMFLVGLDRIIIAPV